MSENVAHTSHWANRDLFAVLLGSMAACGIVFLWARTDIPFTVQMLGTLVGLVVVTVGYTYPVMLYVKRAALADPGTPLQWRATRKIMLLAACLSSVALLGTWGTVQQIPTWADEVAEKLPVTILTARSDSLIWSSVGAIVGTILAALVAEKLGRRLTYSLLCIGSMIIIPVIFLASTPGDAWFLPVVFLAAQSRQPFMVGYLCIFPNSFQRASGLRDRALVSTSAVSLPRLGSCKWSTSRTWSRIPGKSTRCWRPFISWAWYSFGSPPKPRGSPCQPKVLKLAKWVWLNSLVAAGGFG